MTRIRMASMRPNTGVLRGIRSLPFGQPLSFFFNLPLSISCGEIEKFHPSALWVRSLHPLLHDWVEVDVAIHGWL